MFQKNDKALLTCRICIIVAIVILAVASFVIGIVLAIIIHGALCLIALAGWFLCWLLWLLARLYMSYLCDVKLIRNKLYEESNQGLEVFLKAKKERSNSVEMKVRSQATEAELKHLQQLLSSGIITNEEYEKRKKELTEEK